MTWHELGGHETACRSQFPPSTMEDLGLNSGHTPWLQVPLPTEPLHCLFFFKIILIKKKILCVSVLLVGVSVHHELELQTVVSQHVGTESQMGPLEE